MSQSRSDRPQRAWQAARRSLVVVAAVAVVAWAITAARPDPMTLDGLARALEGGPSEDMSYVILDSAGRPNVGLLRTSEYRLDDSTELRMPPSPPFDVSMTVGGTALTCRVDVDRLIAPRVIAVCRER